MQPDIYNLQDISLNKWFGWFWEHKNDGRRSKRRDKPHPGKISHPGWRHGIHLLFCSSFREMFGGEKRLQWASQGTQVTISELTKTSYPHHLILCFWSCFFFFFLLLKAISCNFSGKGDKPESELHISMEVPYKLGAFTELVQDLHLSLE